MTTLTITEALADLKTIDKRIEKKRTQIRTFLVRQDAFKDPLTKDGGSSEYVKREQQAICDLEDRKVMLRRLILFSNLNTFITVSGVSKSIAEWLIWRREVAPGRQTFLSGLRTTIDSTRRDCQVRGGSLVVPGTSDAKPSDIIINLDEAELGKQTEILEEVLGTLDGQLSLKNATVVIEV